VEMYVLKSIDLIKVTDELTYQIPRCNEGNFYLVNPSQMTETITPEMVQGRRFFWRGKTYCFGMSKQVEELLDLSFKSFDILQTELDTSQEKIKILEQKLGNLNKRIDEYKSLSFWQRLKFLFKKKI